MTNIYKPTSVSHYHKTHVSIRGVFIRGANRRTSLP